MVQTFIRTKLNVPVLRRGVLERPALINKLNRGSDGRIFLVTAPAGYGKTTLVVQWLQQQDRPVAWVTLDENDDSPDLFFNLLISALDSAIPDFDGVPFPADGHPEMQQAALLGLINSLADLEAPFVLVLDDLHTLTHPNIHAGLDNLIDHLPANILLALISRERPTLSLPRWRARGWITEISQSELRFDLEQSNRFFSETMALSVPSELAELVSQRVDGWVTGLQFAGLHLQNGQSIDGLALDKVDHFSADYLLAEVLDKEPAETQQFLIQTSILGRMCSGLCNAILNIDDAQKRLEEMETRNLFTLPLDNHREWFRYHPLMGDLLQEQLARRVPQAKINELHTAAAGWFHEQGWLEESVRHALAAGNQTLAVRYLEQIKTGYLWEENGATNVAKWLEQLPPSSLIEHPMLGILAIGSNLLRGEMSNTFYLLEQLEGKEEIEGYWRAIQGNIKRNAGQIDEALADLEIAIDLIDYDDPTWVLLVHLQTVLCHREKGNISASKSLIQDVVHYSDTHKPQDASMLVAMMLKWMQGILGVVEGDYYRAKDFFEAGLQLSRQAPVQRRTVRGYLLNGLSRIHFLWHELDLAEAYARQSLEIGERTGISDYILSSIIQLLDIAAMRGDRSAVKSNLNELQTRIRRAQFEPFGEMFKLFIIDVHLRMGDDAPATRWVKQHDFDNLAELDLVDRETYLLWVRTNLLHVRQSAPDYDARTCDRLIAFCHRLLDTGRAVTDFLLSLEAHLILSELYDFVAQPEARDEQMRAALRMAELSGVIQPFVKIRPLVAKATQQIGRSEFQILDKILPGASPSQPAGGMLPDLAIPVELTGRELDILRSLAEGLSNKEIELQHVISRNTVRTHLRNLYSKLDVNSRTQAVLKAQEMGLV